MLVCCLVTLRHSRVSNPSLFPNFHESGYIKDLFLFWLWRFTAWLCFVLNVFLYLSSRVLRRFYYLEPIV